MIKYIILQQLIILFATLYIKKSENQIPILD